MPNVDPVWIDPDENGWIGEPATVQQYDEDDNPIPADPIKITTWLAHKGSTGEFDHLWLVLPGCEEGDHWDGKVYSSEGAVP